MTTEIENYVEQVNWRDMEPQRRFSWRCDRAYKLGFDQEIAADIAVGPLDIHDLEALIKRGCSPALALEILS